MTDVEDRVREMLRRRADDVPVHVEAPPRMLRRAWRRMLMALTGAVVAVALAGIGAATAVRLMSDRNTPGATASVAACRAEELHGTVRLQGEQGYRVGSLEVTNVGTATCSLRGQPTVSLVGQRGAVLALREGSTDPWWMARSSPQPRGWPVVVLRPGQSAGIRTVWTSWCGEAQPAVWRIVIPGGGVLDLPDPSGEAPFCHGRSSKVEVGPFEPVS